MGRARAECVVGHQIGLHAGLRVPTGNVPGEGLGVGALSGGDGEDGVDDGNIRSPQTKRRQEKKGEKGEAQGQTLWR